MKKILLCLLLVAVFVLPVRQVVAQTGHLPVLKSDRSFFIIPDGELTAKQVVKSVAPKKKKTTVANLFDAKAVNARKEWRRRDPSGIEGDTLHALELSVMRMQIVFIGDSMVTKFTPDKVLILQKDFTELSEYVDSHPGVDCYLVAPEVEYAYGYLQSTGLINLVMGYGTVSPFDTLYKGFPKDELYGYLPLEKVIVYTSTMSRWVGPWSDPVPLEIYQTSIVRCEIMKKVVSRTEDLGTSRVVKKDTIVGLKIWTEIVSVTSKDFFPTEIDCPALLQYERVLLIEAEDTESVVLYDQSPYDGLKYEEREEHSREIYQPVIITTDVACDLSADIILGDAHVPQDSVPVQVVLETVVEHVDVQVLPVPQISFTQSGSSVVVEWKPVADATEYTVRLYYEDGTYNTKYASSTSPVVFKNISPGEKCRLVMTAKNSIGKVIATEELPFTM